MYCVTTCFIYKEAAADSCNEAGRSREINSDPNIIIPNPLLTCWNVDQKK
jgi:hypothetical protein